MKGFTQILQQISLQEPKLLPGSGAVKAQGTQPGPARTLAGNLGNATGHKINSAQRRSHREGGPGVMPHKKSPNTRSATLQGTGDGKVPSGQ